MRIVFSEDGRDFHGRGWDLLVDSDPDATFFHTPAFLKLYWEEFGEAPEHLLLAFAETDDGQQVAAVAFERVDGVLRFLGGTDVTDYMGPVGLVEHKKEAAEALWQALLTRDDWRQADLRGLSQDGAWLELLRETAQAAGLRVEETEDQNGTAPYLELPSTWDAYLESLSSKHRHEIKRKAHKLEDGSGPYEIETATQATLIPLLDRFVELHRMSEGPKGVFMKPGMEIFFRRLAEAFLPAGIFRLSFIKTGGVLSAGTIGYSFQGRFYLYNSAFDRDWQHLAPGMVLVAEDIRMSIEEGLSGFDMLKGDYAYKYRFGSTARYVRRLVVDR